VCDLEEGALTQIGNGAVLELLGAAPDSAVYAAASPIARLPLGSPVLLIHGDADEDVPVSQSRRFDQAARAAGDDCELHELPGAGHFEVIDPGGRGWPIVNNRLRSLVAG
jgi:pimeloyl-ACP methyl ester carboxylesterase